jgi:hypothetical protein
VAVSDAVDNTSSYGETQRPNLIGNPAAGSCPDVNNLNGGDPIPPGSINCWFNTSAFEQPAAYTLGNGPRVMPKLKVPGIKNLDFSFEKWWNLHGETARIQFRTEFYNALNHVNFFSPNSVLGSSTFGQITQAAPARSIQVGLKLNW